MEWWILLLAFTTVTSIMAVGLEYLFHGTSRVTVPCFKLMLVIMMIPFVQFAVVLFVLAQPLLTAHD